MSTTTLSTPIATESSTRARPGLRTLLEWGGLAAGAILIAFGIAAIVMGVNGRSTVRDSLRLEQIVGSPDMTPAAIKAEATKAGLTGVSLPTASVAGKSITTGARARTFAEYMRIHALEATGGADVLADGDVRGKGRRPEVRIEPGGGTSDASYAVVDPKTNQPVSNGVRNIWVTETALTTALNTSYMAENLALFGIVVGVALLLSGIGFEILALATFHRRREQAA